MEPKAYVKVLLDEHAELIGVEKDGKFFPAEEVPEHKVPHMVKENWDLKLMKIWHNQPCCVQVGTRRVCWPPCV
ncbi:MAG: hypothetical protein AB9873_17145 [Syntrophobacteraceae bacterium]